VSTRIGAVEISSDSSTSLEFLSLLGTASPSTLLFQPSALDFGAQLVGSTNTLPILITNAGTEPALFNGVTITGDYSSSSTCPSDGLLLAPNANCTANITFKPTATGVRSGTYSLTSSASGSALLAALTGTGRQSRLQVSPDSLSFNSTAAGATSSLSLTLTNTGTASATALKLVITGDYALISSCSLTRLIPGASCTLVVGFTPTAPGIRNGLLTITSSDSVSQDTIALTGTTIEPPGNGTFSFTVNGGSTASQTVQPGRPATYALTLTPLNGYSGTIILACNAVTAAPAAVCSLLPATVTLSGSSQNASVTINTLSSTELHRPASRGSARSTTLCILVPSAIALWSMRRRLRVAKRPASLFLALLYSTMLLLAAGCGTGSANSLNVTPPGTYQYSVSASSNSGTPLTQAITLNVTIP
jgi:hypothetical protein